MSNVWILDTETKGTGAHMAPLESKRPSAERELNLARFTRPASPPPSPADAPDPEPRRFKVVDVMSSQVLAEHVDTATALAALEPLRSMTDARVYVWQPERKRWRMLGRGETKALWRFRGRRRAEHDLTPA